MLEVGDTASAFEAPMATPENAAGKSGEYTAEEVEPFALADALAEGPVVLAFFPGCSRGPARGSCARCATGGASSRPSRDRCTG